MEWHFKLSFGGKSTNLLRFLMSLVTTDIATISAIKIAACSYYPQNCPGALLRYLPIKTDVPVALIGTA